MPPKTPRLDAQVRSMELSYGARVVPKTGWFWQLLGWLLRPINPQFLTGYVTTIGPFVAVPSPWPIDEIRKVIVLRHEAVHLAQQKRLGLGSIWLGLIPFGVAYLLLPLPIGFAWCRFVFEAAAYGESIRATRLLIGDAAEATAIDKAVLHLTGRAYGWAMPWPGFVRNWLIRESE